MNELSLRFHFKSQKRVISIYFCAFFFPLSGHMILDLSSDATLSYNPNALTTHPEPHFRRGWLFLSREVSACQGGVTAPEAGH